MARFIQQSYPTEHAGLVRVTRGLQTVAALDRSVSRPVLAVLATIGSPVTRVVAKVSASFTAWVATRRQAQADKRLWDLALTDARVMADLSRAMTDEARRPVAH